MRTAKLGIPFLIGFFLYAMIEITARGYTHWTMALTGGACFLIIYLLNGALRTETVLFRSLVGASVITAAELIVGVTVNIILKWDVWDYSSLPFNFLVQICLRYSILWFLLCVPVAWVCTGIAKII